MDQDTTKLRTQDRLYDISVPNISEVTFNYCHKAQLVTALVNKILPESIKLEKCVDTLARNGDKVKIRLTNGRLVEADAGMLLIPRRFPGGHGLSSLQ